MVFTTSINHPKEFSVVSGNTDLSVEVDSINQSIRLILMTARGELFGDPNFGSRLHEYLFDYSGEALYGLLRSEIASVLNGQESRITVFEDNISFKESGTTLLVDIKYTIRYTNHSSETTLLIKKEEDSWVI